VTAEVITIPQRQPVEALIEVALATCESPETRRSYSTQLRKFIASGRPLTREGVAFFLQAQREAGNGPATLSSCLAAIRRLVAEAHVRGLVSDAEYYGIGQLKSGKVYKNRRGLWLTLAQTKQLLALPDRAANWGKRDACLLSCMIGCGFRREEMARLRWSHYQEREGRMCWVDFVGKGRKQRTVPVPSWAQADIDAWRETALNEPHPPRPAGTEANPRYALDNEYVMQGYAAFSLYRIIERYGEKLGLDLAPHDLRRTLAQLLRKSGAPLEQIQHTLGHEKIATTVIYLGASLELAPGAAAVDKIALGMPATGPQTPQGAPGGAR
jgi:integrase